MNARAKGEGEMHASRLICIGFALGQSVLQAAAVESSKLVQPVDKYGITEQERAACSVDALTFCSDTYPDEVKLLACMKSNRANLSTGCKVIFEQGVRRRHL